MIIIVVAALFCAYDQAPQDHALGLYTSSATPGLCPFGDQHASGHLHLLEIRTDVC